MWLYNKQQSILNYFITQYSDKKIDGLNDLYDLVPPNERNIIESDFELYLFLIREYDIFNNTDSQILQHLQNHFKYRYDSSIYNKLSKKYPLTNEQRKEKEEKEEKEKEEKEEKEKIKEKAIKRRLESIEKSYAKEENQKEENQKEENQKEENQKEENYKRRKSKRRKL